MAICLVGSGLRADTESGVTPDLDDSLAVFEALLSTLKSEVAAGHRGTEALPAADELAFELEKDLIRGDAEIEILRLEVLRRDGDLERQALDRLITAIAARERRVRDQIRRLEQLSGISMAACPPSSLAPPDEEPPGAEAGFKIIFEASDPTVDPVP
jgi:hypothetical protein